MNTLGVNKNCEINTPQSENVYIGDFNRYRKCKVTIKTCVVDQVTRSSLSLTIQMYFIQLHLINRLHSSPVLQKTAVFNFLTLYIAILFDLNRLHGWL